MQCCEYDLTQRLPGNINTVEEHPKTRFRTGPGTFPPFGRRYLELVLLPVDDDGRDLLIHEDEDGAEQGGDDRHDGGPPGVRAQRADEPAPVVSGRLHGCVCWSLE